MKDYHTCSLDGGECNHDNCDTCNKITKQSPEEPANEWLQRTQDDINEHCFKNHPEKMNTVCFDCELLGKC